MTNKRIAELREQAFELCKKYDDDCGSDLVKTDEVFQKFAELILTEVTDILATYRVKVRFDDGIEYNCQHPIYAIQKHFGVK